MLENYRGGLMEKVYMGLDQICSRAGRKVQKCSKEKETRFRQRVPLGEFEVHSLSENHGSKPIWSCWISDGEAELGGDGTGDGKSVESGMVLI